MFIGGLKSIGPQIYEAASLDGVGRWTRLRRITFPLLAPAMTINVLLAVIGSFTTYNLIYVLTDGQYATQTLGMLAFNAAFGLSGQPGLRRGGQRGAVRAHPDRGAAADAVLRLRERRLLG